MKTEKTKYKETGLYPNQLRKLAKELKLDNQGTIEEVVARIDAYWDRLPKEVKDTLDRLVEQNADKQVAIKELKKVGLITVKEEKAPNKEDK